MSFLNSVNRYAPEMKQDLQALTLGSAIKTLSG